MSKTTKGTIISNSQCPLCVEEGRDSNADNLATFDSGVQYCVAGHGTISKTEIITKPIQTKAPSSAPSSKFKSGVYSNINTRGLTKKTCEYYGYMINYEEKIHIANYYDEAGNVVMQQIRDKNKNFPIVGNKEYNETLWGIDKFTPNPNVFITITEGQIDALSVAQAFECKYPVVSLPNGVLSAANVLRKSLKKLLGFKYVILAFDNDKPGHDAVKECLSIFEPGTVRVAKWRLKDASDLLQAGREDEIRETIYKAVEYIPDPIITGQQLLECLQAYKFKTKLWPLDSMNKILSPMQIPAVYTFVARPGVGKTELMMDVIRHEIKNGNKVGIIALEQTMSQILTKVADSVNGTSLSKIRNRFLTAEEISTVVNVTNNLVIYDHIKYGSSIKSIVENIPYMVRGLGCEVVIFDNLSYSATSADGDERREIDRAMVAFKDSTVKYNFTLLNVCHLKKSSESIIEEGQPPISADDIRGSGGIEMYSTYIIGLHRNKNTEDILEKNTLELYVLKDNVQGEDSGKKLKLHYNTEQRCLEDKL